MASAQTTADRISTDDGVDLFYELRITGLPYRIYGAVNPYDGNRWADPWTLPDGVTAVPGLGPVDDALEQSIRDVVGGLATPERIRVTLNDWEDHDSAIGAHQFFGRLFATGRVFADTSVQYGFLAEDLSADAANGDTISVANIPAASYPGVMYIGTETISYSTAGAGAGALTELTIDERNLYPAYTSADGLRTYPPVPYHRAWTGAGATEIPGREALVASVPYTIVGRVACLYVGHRRPTSGEVEAESTRQCLIIGRIRALDYEAGQWTIEIESVISELEQAQCAPDLPSAALMPQLHLPDQAWREFVVGVMRYDEDDGTMAAIYQQTITLDAAWVPAGVVNVFRSVAEGAPMKDLCSAINYAIKDQAPTTGKGALIRRMGPMFQVDKVDGVEKVVVRAREFVAGGSDVLGLDDDMSYVFAIRSPRSVGTDGPPFVVSTLSVLGFPEGNTWLAGEHSEDEDERWTILTAERPVVDVFIPRASTLPMTLYLASVDGAGKPGARFDDLQVLGDPARVRFGDGMVASVTAVTDDTITIHNALSAAGLAWDDVRAPGYVVPQGKPATVEQVIVLPPFSASSGDFLWRLLCSDWNSIYDGEYDYLTMKAGLGWNDIVDKDSFRLGIDASPILQRRAVIDSRTIWSDLFVPIARENHAFLAWDPVGEWFTLRKLQLPTPDEAEDLEFTDSNRPVPEDWTHGEEDQSMLRTGWHIKHGYDWTDKKFWAETHYTDQFARSAFATTAKEETIEDKSLFGKPSDAAAIVQALIEKSPWHRYPCRRYKRRMNLRGMHLSPGTIHRVVDNTIINPFTGQHGVTANDNIYGLVVSVARTPWTGVVDVVFIVLGFDYQNVRPWSPTARVDFDAASNGYVAATKTLTLANRYTNWDGAVYDGKDFVANDKIRLVPRDADGSVTALNGTVSTVSADGRTVVLTTDPTAGAGLSTTKETVMILQPYADQTATRQAGTASFMGDVSSGLIDALTRCHLFA